MTDAELERASLRSIRSMKAVLVAEIGDHADKRKLYKRALDDYAAAHPRLERREVCAECYRALNRRYYDTWGEERGVPEEDCRVGKSWFWIVGSLSGYTSASYGDGRYDEQRDSGSGTDATSFIGEDGGAPPPRGSVRAIEAMERLRSMLREAQAYMARNDCKKLAGKAAVDTFVIEAEAYAKGIRELMNPRRRVPTNAQPMFYAMVSAVHTVDALMRRLYAAIGSAELDARRPMTKKAISNIVRGRTGDMARVCEPRSHNNAYMRGYMGAKCPKCGSRRSAPVTDSASEPMVHCLKCADGERFPAPEWVACMRCQRQLGDPLPSHCPHCGEAVPTPEEAHDAAR